jgi:antitoxin CcdA
MRMNLHKPARRKPTNVSLDPDLLASARELGVNVSRACEAGLAAELKAAREARWIEENREAIESSNRWVAEHGMPLAEYRNF